MWSNENRCRYNRDHLRYPSDLTDAEWARIAPLIPPAKRGGRKREVDLREVVNGVMSVLSTGRLPVAGDPEGPAPAQHGAWLSRPLALGRHAGSHPPRALHAMP